MPSTGGDPRAFDPQLRRGKDVAGAKRLVNKVPYPRPQRRRHGLEDHVPPDQTERGDRRNHEGEDDADRCPTGGPVSNTRLRGRPRFGEWPPVFGRAVLASTVPPYRADRPTAT